MRYIWDFRSLRLEDCELTIGSFDGVHQGHQALVSSMVADSRKANLPSVVLTFFPHPSIVLRPPQSAFYLSSPQMKAEMLDRLGVTFMVTQHFDRQFSQQKASDFLALLRAHLPFRTLWLSESFTFGKDREGDRSYLEEASVASGFQLRVVPPTLVDGGLVSSTRIRQALWAGDVATAGRLLGRPYTVPGIVVSGADRGRQLGVPTANLSLWSEQAHPRNGVYACIARVGGSRWKAVTNIGLRPTFETNQDDLVVEAHLLDFAGDLRGRAVRLAFIERLRDERRFPTSETLVAQIKEDIARASDILDSVEEDVNV